MGDGNIDGRKVAREVRLEYWSGGIQARNQSRQTIREYCGENGVNEKSYYYWQTRLREAVCEALAVRQENGVAPTFSEIPLSLSKCNQHAAIASDILDRVLHHTTVINIKGESYRLKERKEYMKQKQHIVNTLFLQFLFGVDSKHYYSYITAGSAKFLRIYYVRVKEYLDSLESAD